MGSNLENTQRDIVISVANRLGNDKKPSEYIDHIYEKYGLEISNSVVCRALGSWSSRLTVDNKRMITLAKQLLSECKFDKHLASYAIASAMRS